MNDHLSFSPPCQSPPSMSALISSNTPHQRKSPDCSSKFLMYTSNSYSAAEYSTWNPRFPRCDCVAEGQVNSCPYPVLFLGPAILFDKNNGSPDLHLRGSKTAPLCENCSCSSQWAVSSSLCKTWSWIMLELTEELAASTEVQSNTSECMTVLSGKTKRILFLLLCKVFTTMRRQGCRALVSDSAAASVC